MSVTENRRGLSESLIGTIKVLGNGGRLLLPEGMIEKDILVADAVRTICAVGQNRGAQIIFTGGTSLSQAYQIIERMSEDADFRIVLPPDITKESARPELVQTAPKKPTGRSGGPGMS